MSDLALQQLSRYAPSAFLHCAVTTKLNLLRPWLQFATLPESRRTTVPDHLPTHSTLFPGAQVSRSPYSEDA